MGKAGQYAVAGGAISIGVCFLLYLVLGSFLNGALVLVACGVLFALPGIVVACTLWLREQFQRHDGDK